MGKNSRNPDLVCKNTLSRTCIGGEMLSAVGDMLPKQRSFGFFSRQGLPHLETPYNTFANRADPYQAALLSWTNGDSNALLL